jgi:hypothetical protein
VAASRPLPTTLSAVPCTSIDASETKYCRIVSVRPADPVSDLRCPSASLHSQHHLHVGG